MGNEILSKMLPLTKLFALKRKSILRRQITNALLELEIETATKSIAGNNLFFINPNPMDEE